MTQSTTTPRRDRPRPSLSRIRRAVIAVAGLVSLTLVAACGSGVSSASQAADAAASNTGTGVVTRPGPSAGGDSSGNETTANYSVAFAECMRAHGIPKFPNPDGSEGQLGPDSGVNPGSSAFQAAVSGPCKSLAPAGWVSSGPVTKGGGS